MLVTVDWIEKHYNKFNHLYFSDSLPIIKFKVNKSKTNWGCAYFRYDYLNNTVIPTELTMSNYYDSPEEVKIQTLLHEMIHIKDYTFYPEHFVHNGKAVSARRYNAHGSWFMNECHRISEESGYLVTNRVTKEEMSVSTISPKVKRNLAIRQDDALICAVIGKNGSILYFKTDVHKVKYLKEHLKKDYTWKSIGGFKSMKFFTFENIALAAHRSCGARIRGWKTDEFGFANKMREFKAKEVSI